MTWRLITIRPSHYNEKARWALDRFGITYDEEPWMPVLHFIGSGKAVLPRRAGQADKQSTRLSTPILITEDRTLADSSDIVGFVSRHVGDPTRSLHWSSEAIDLDRRFCASFGADTRRLAYHHLLPREDLLVELAQRSVGPTQARAWIAMRKGVRKILIEKLQVYPDKAARSLERILAEFAAVDDLLGDGRPFLAGDRFSVADLSFACMASLALVVQPHEGYGAWLPALDQLPREYADLARRLRDTRAGEHVLRMFAEQRGTRIQPCRVS